jgi:hypothetical protein
VKKLKENLKHFFVPHEGNNYKARVFHEATLSIFFAIVLVTFIGGIAQKVTLTSTNFLANVYSGVLVDLTNEERLHNALGQLTVSPVLENAAQMKAEDMAAKGYFAHYGPDGSTPWDWMKKAGYNYADAGENLAIDFTDSNDVDEAWMNSPTHRANILNSKFTEIGIATIKGSYQGRNTIYVVQMFGRPLKTTNTSLATSISTVPIGQLSNTPQSTGTPTVKGIETVPTPKPVIAATPKPKVTSPVVSKPIVISNTSSSFVNATTEETFVSTENTSTPVVAGPVQNNDSPGPIEGSWLMNLLKEIATNPDKTLDTIYFAIAFVIIIGLLGMIKKDIQVHHLQHAFGGVLLIVIMISLAFVYKEFGYTATTIVATNYL